MTREYRSAAVSTVVVLACFWASTVVSQTLSLYQSESEFFANAPIVSTESFDSFATPTHVLEPIIVIDEIVYEKEPSTTCLDSPEDVCWSINDRSFGGPPPVTLPNLLYSPHPGEIRDGTGDFISFGENRIVKAFGFYFIGLVDLDLVDEYNIQMCGWEIVIHETDGTTTTIDLPPATASAAAYFGFVSQIGISSLALGASIPPGICYSFFSFGYDEVSRAAFESIVQEISVDIKPGSDTNSINPKKKGVIPIAITGAVDFDVAQVDNSTVRFGPSEAEPFHNGHIGDVNNDGFADYVFHFRAAETGIICDDAYATLSGQTFGGDAITGTDTVKTAGCK